MSKIADTELRNLIKSGIKERIQYKNMDTEEKALADIFIVDPCTDMEFTFRKQLKTKSFDFSFDNSRFIKEAGKELFFDLLGEPIEAVESGIVKQSADLFYTIGSLREKLYSVYFLTEDSKLSFMQNSVFSDIKKHPELFLGDIKSNLSSSFMRTISLKAGEIALGKIEYDEVSFNLSLIECAPMYPEFIEEDLVVLAGTTVELPERMYSLIKSDIQITFEDSNFLAVSASEHKSFSITSPDDDANLKIVYQKEFLSNSDKDLISSMEDSRSVKVVQRAYFLIDVLSTNGSISSYIPNGIYTIDEFNDISKNSDWTAFDGKFFFDFYLSPVYSYRINSLFPSITVPSGKIFDHIHKDNYRVRVS